MNRKRIFRLSMMSLVVAGLGYITPAQSREPASDDFLSVIADVDVPPSAAPVENKRAVPPAAAPMAVSQDKTLQLLRNENEKLKASLARQNNTLRKKNELSVRDQTALRQALSALERQLKQQTTIRVAAEQKVADLQRAALQAPVPAQPAASTLLAEREKAQRELKKAQSESDDLHKQMTALASMRDDLKKQLEQANARQQQLVTSGEAALAQVKSLQQESAALKAVAQQGKPMQAEVTELRRQRDGLQQKLTQSQQALSALQENSQTARGSAKQQVNALQQQINELSSTRESLQKELVQIDGNLNKSLATEAAALAQVKSLQQENAALKTATQTQQQEAQKQTATQVEKSGQAEALLKTLTAERDDLRKQLTELTGQHTALVESQRQEKANQPASAVPELKTERQKQAYASGAILAGNFQRTLMLHRDLGADLSAALLIAGLSDGVNSKIRLDSTTLQDSYRALITELAKREKEKYSEGVKQLEKLASGKALIKRNGTLFFVQTRKGNGKVASGETVRFDMTESVVKGKTLNNEKGVSVTVDNKLPYVIEQALTLAGRGGEIIVYCMASDVYPPDQLPEGVFPYTLIKYQFNQKAKSAK